jgi:hypothetical protein
MRLECFTIQFQRRKASGPIPNPASEAQGVWTDSQSSFRGAMHLDCCTIQFPGRKAPALMSNSS